MKNHRRDTQPEPNYQQQAEELATELHTLKQRYHVMLQAQQGEDKPQNRQTRAIIGHLLGHLHVTISFAGHVSSDGRP